MKVMYKVTFILLLLSLMFNGFQFFLIENNQASQIDGDLRVAISRISSSLNEKDVRKYITAIEHSSKANALSRYSSYAKEDPYVIGYTSELINVFRDLYVGNKEIKNPEEIIHLISTLSANPNDKDSASNLLLKLKSNY